MAVKRGIRKHEHRSRLYGRRIDPLQVDRTLRVSNLRRVATIVPPDTSDKIAGQGTNTRTDSGAGPHFPIGIASIIENGKSDVESRSVTVQGVSRFGSSDGTT